MKKNLPITNEEKTFPATTNILSTTDLDGKITYINKDFINISGFTKSELLGENHHIVATQTCRLKFSKSYGPIYVPINRGWGL